MKMREEDIPGFVQAIIDTGCDICAVGHEAYAIGDSDLSWDEREAIETELREINAKFGNRDHLKLEIVAYLRFLGRYLDVEEH